MAKRTSINQAKYDKEHVEKYFLKLHKENDKDIIKAINPANKQGSIKALIRKGLNS